MTYCGQIAVKGQRVLWYVDISQRKKPHICRNFSSALGRTRTCDLLIRNYTYYVYGCSWKFENALDKPNLVSHRFSLFAPVTVKSLSKTGVSP